MVSSEAVPFSKSGGLADVVGALSHELNKENNVRIFMPFYSFIDRKGFKKDISWSFDMLEEHITVSCVKKREKNVEYIGLCHPYFTERKGIYGDTSFTPYQDNAKRFALFALAAVSYMKESGFDADIVHSHDWPAGLVSYIVKKEKMKAKTVFTIHNLAYQGVFSRYDAVTFGFALDKRLYNNSSLNKQINFLKAGIEFSDKITTVSPTYAEEIKTASHGEGLDWLLREREKDLKGIINGIDTQEWNPKTDKNILYKYSSSDLSGKEKMKEYVQQREGLEVNADIPLFAMISRLADQKGYTELLSGSPSALERILEKNNCQFVIIGTGDKFFEEKLETLSRKYRNLSAKIMFSNAESHILEAGADFFLMPSRFEPCGLNQIYSLHYGTLPVAHSTGGLKDSICDYSQKDADGFLFETLNGEEIIAATERAIKEYNEDRSGIEKARKRGMKKDFSWKKSAGEYISLYNSL